jgi:hypothetical protein
VLRAPKQTNLRTNKLTNKLTMSSVAINKQFLIGQLTMPSVLCDIVKDYIFVDKVTSDNRKYMRDHVLGLIRGLRCVEEVDPLTYATGITQSYRCFKNYQTEQRARPTYIHSTICACCGDYRVYNSCQNSRCNCTTTYQEWDDDHYEQDQVTQSEYEEYQDWYDDLVEEEWNEEDWEP